MEKTSHLEQLSGTAGPRARRGALTLGVDVGGSSIKWVARDGTRIVAKGSVETPQTSREDVLAAVVELVRAQPEATAVGLALPGVIDAAQSRSVLVPNLPGSWSDQPIVAPLSDVLGLSVALCNDARAFAVAEQQLGAARGIDDVVAVTLGTGLGCGIITNGRLVQGRGELGHVQVAGSDTPCGCGLTGCLETVAGPRPIVRQASEAIAAGQPTSLIAGELTAKAVVDAARAGDPVAERVVHRAGEALGTALAALVTALGTEVVVIGGGLSSALDLLAPVIEAPIRRRAPVIGGCRVVASSLGLHAGAIGAALCKETTRCTMPPHRRP